MATSKSQEKREKVLKGETLGGGNTAKRDFVISHNEHQIVIKKGDDLSEVPKLFFENLKTEQVI